MTSTQNQLETFHAYHGVSNWRGAFDLAAHYVVAFGLMAIASHYPHPAVIVTAFVLIGGLQNGLMSLQHDAWHHLCFKPQKLNDVVCSFLTAYTLGSSYYYNQVRHRGHHAYFGTAKDPDQETFLNDGRETPSRLIAYFTYVLCGGSLVERVKLILTKNASELPGMDLRPKNMPSRSQELGCIVVAQLSMIGLCALTGHWWNYFAFWFAPLVTVGAFLTMARQFIEHANPSAGEVEPAVRLQEFDANFVERFFFSPAHFEHHAFHHAFPKIPHYRLIAAKQFARENAVTYKTRLRKGYVAVFIEHIRSLKIEEKCAPTLQK
jgi:fatty acid desaturase